MSFFRDFKKIIALFLAIILLFFSALVPVKRARAVVIETVAVVSLIAVGLVACGIAVASTDNGEDTSTALGYAVNYVNTKMQDAQKTAFQVGLYTATGAINLGSQAWQWIKEASANIYLNSSKYIVDSTGNTVQIGNLNNWGNCRYLSGTFYVVNYYNRQTYYVSTDVVYDSSIGSGINVYSIDATSLIFYYRLNQGSFAFTSNSSSFLNLSSNSSIDFYIDNGIYYYSWGLANSYFWADSIDVSSFSSFTNSVSDSSFLDSHFGLRYYSSSISNSYNNTTIDGTGILDKVNSATQQYMGTHDYLNGVKDQVTGGSVSADIDSSQLNRLLQGYDVQATNDLINVGEIQREYGSISSWLANIRSGVTNAYQDLLNIGCQPYVSVGANGQLVTTDKDGYLIDASGSLVGSETGVLVGDGTIVGNPAVPATGTVAVPLTGTGSIPFSDTATGTIDISKTIDIPLDNTFPSSDSSSGNKKYQFSFLTDLFPFCLPFDAYDFLMIFSADPVAPNFDFPFLFTDYFDESDTSKIKSFHYSQDYQGKDFIEISDGIFMFNMSAFDDLAEIFRYLFLFAWIVLLCVAFYRFIHK